MKIVEIEIPKRLNAYELIPGKLIVTSNKTSAIFLEFSKSNVGYRKKLIRLLYI